MAAVRANAYRRLVGLRFDRGLLRVVVFGLVLLWGWGMYEVHWGGGWAEDPETVEELTLVFQDRTLRVAGALDGAPEWLRWVLGYGSYQDELEAAQDVLWELSDQGALGEDGHAALVAGELALGGEVPEGLRVPGWLEGVGDGGQAPAAVIESLDKRLAAGEAQWWEVALARQLGGEPLAAAVAVEDARSQRLLGRELVCHAGNWLLVGIGLVLVPRAWRVLRAGGAVWERATRRSYPWRWGFMLLVWVFVTADLAAGWLAEVGYGVFGGSAGYWDEVALDLAWRLAGPVLALVVLFRRPRHVLRTLRLNGSVSWPVVMAVLAVLSLVNVLLNGLLGQFEPLDPTGGLDAMEDGTRGLVYGLLSACVVAPLAEEVMYRGILLRGLERHMSFWKAALTVACVFAFGHHYGWLGLVSVGIFGFSAAIVYRATNSLTTAIVLHSLYNLSATLPAWWLYHARF